MTTFKYQGLSPAGAELSGVIRASSEQEAVSRIRESCAVITSIQELKEDGEKKKSKGKLKVTEKDLAIMCSQLAIILKSGIPIVRCMEMVAEQADSPELRSALEDVAEDIDGGMSMCRAFEVHLPNLPTTFTETIRAGESSGTLELCFDRLHSYYDKSYKTKGKVKSALTYPAIVIVVAIIVFFVIMLKAVPMFKETFADMGVELPGVTTALIGFSDFMLKRWWAVLLIIGGIVFGILAFRRTENGKAKLAEWMLLKMPFHKIIQMNACSLFASTMSTMLTSGMTVLDALEVTAGVSGNYMFGESVMKVREEVERGSTILRSMREKKAFPKLLTEMTGVGEDSGSLPETLDVVADYFDNEVSLSTDKLVSMMEPVITVVLAVIVVILLLAVYLPMFSMYSGM